MPPETTKETQALAEDIVRWLYTATFGVPREPRRLVRIPGVTGRGIMYALERGWIELESYDSISLTEEGRTLILRQVH